MNQDFFVGIVREVIKVHDGDTYTFLLDLGHDTFKRVTVRSAVVDCYETRKVRGADEAEKVHGKRAKAIAEVMLRGAHKITVMTFKKYTRHAGVVAKKGKYGRYLAEVHLEYEHVGGLFRIELGKLLKMLRYSRSAVTVPDLETDMGYFAGEIGTRCGFRITKYEDGSVELRKGLVYKELVYA